jgi:hypothetical protein
MRNLVILILVLGCASAGPVASTPPFPVAGGYKGPFNNDDQGHADFCVRLTVAAAALRYADGSPSGFALTPDILVPVQSNGVSCPDTGMARLDAREIVTASDGTPMLFHRGGWGFAGNDPESAVHFGHVRVADLDTTGLRFIRDSTARRWIPAPTRPWSGLGQQRGNGTACASRAAAPLTVSVQSIPGDMRYLNSRQTAAIASAEWVGRSALRRDSSRRRWMAVWVGGIPSHACSGGRGCIPPSLIQHRRILGARQFSAAHVASQGEHQRLNYNFTDLERITRIVPGDVPRSAR